MAKYDCAQCINVYSNICEYCSRTHMPSGKEQKPRYFIRSTEVGKVTDEKLANYIKGCVDRGKSISTAVICKYNKDIETASE